MVVALGPGRFYGSALPRPWFYSDVKHNDDRVDPPPTVTDPLLSWAREAHWSMGGLSFQRRRLQGRIEGSIKKLQAEAESSKKKTLDTHLKKTVKVVAEAPLISPPSLVADPDADKASPPPIVSRKNKKRARRLREEFDRIAEEQEDTSEKMGKVLQDLEIEREDRSKDMKTSAHSEIDSYSIGRRTRSRNSFIKSDSSSENSASGVGVGVGSKRRTSPRIKNAAALR